ASPNASAEHPKCDPFAATHERLAKLRALFVEMPQILLLHELLGAMCPRWARDKREVDVGLMERRDRAFVFNARRCHFF
ncbi:MAG: hypothetical protein ACXU9D_03890, partial [Xanthobacteraceae bacterium]